MLDKLYQDFFELFETDMFHMGGDEVNMNCWNTTTEIKEYLRKQGKSGTEEDLLDIWEMFQSKAAEKVYKAAGKKLPLILWTNSLTEKVKKDRSSSRNPDSFKKSTLRFIPKI